MVTQAAIQVVASALALGADAAGAKRADLALRAQLEAVSRLSVFFGHQSVGANILEGLQRLAAQQGVTVRLEALPSPPAPGSLVHALIGANGDPELKIRAFSEAVTGPARGAQVALMKLCYVDFHATTGPAALFERYRAELAKLRRKRPAIAFVHVTAPLTSAQRGLEPLVKRLLGRETSEALNARREAYNSLLREAYAGREPVLDLAAAESTRPDGSREVVSWNGQAVPAMVATYTDDGGHLNPAGEERAARALVAVLAALPEARGAR
jgi:lysophospholipase L1-like esterase